MKKEFMLSISVFDSNDEEKIVLFRDINKKLYRKIQKLIDKKEQKVKSFKGLKEPLNDLAISQKHLMKGVSYGQQGQFDR